MGYLWKQERKVKGVNANLRTPRTRSTSSRERQQLDGGESSFIRAMFPRQTQPHPHNLLVLATPSRRWRGGVLLGQNVYDTSARRGTPQGILGAKRGNEAELVATDADACGMALEDEGRGVARRERDGGGVEAVRAQGDSIELETEGIDPFDRNKGRDTAAACSARGWVPSVYMFLFSEENRTAVPWYRWMYILNRKPFEDVVNFKPIQLSL
ncbi:hypothetical protein K438DRAFT_1777164 [Mycena galopus ATCC 62051]|nr:hypothetical protein K438DRAFT_1777164 [Mycena galopus ATCC 62051]